METEKVLIKSTIHHGHNLHRLREGAGMKQFTFASLVGVPQQRISKYEAMPVIDDEVLKKFAGALGVPVEVIKNMKEDMPSIVIENNSFDFEPDSRSNANVGTENNSSDFEPHSKSNANVGTGNDVNSTNHFDPVEKVMQLSEEKAQLYERLIKIEQERNDALEKRLSALEQK